MENNEFISYFLPAGIMDYFILSDINNNEENITIELEEKNIPPEKYKTKKLLSKGFMDTVTIQDFPLRGKACFLKVKRRRWTMQETGLTVCRDWDLVAKGTRMTDEFATFLKGINR